MRCPTCRTPIAGTYRIRGESLCVDCARVALGHVRAERRRPSDEQVRAFFDCELASDPTGPVVRDVVAAMYARCA